MSHVKHHKEIHRNARRKFLSEEKNLIVLDGLRGKSSTLSCVARKASTAVYITAGAKTS